MQVYGHIKRYGVMIGIKLDEWPSQEAATATALSLATLFLDYISWL